MATMATRPGETFVQWKYKGTHLTATGLLMEGCFAGYIPTKSQGDLRAIPSLELSMLLVSMHDPSFHTDNCEKLHALVITWTISSYEFVSNTPLARLHGGNPMRQVLSLAVLTAMFCSLDWAADASKELEAATQVVQNMSSSKQVPSSLLRQARCIAVIPKLTKAGFIVGGKHGNGVVSCRTHSGWSAPAFISMSGGSIGLQAGAEHQDILLLMNSQGEQELKNGHWELRGEAAAAGPSGGTGTEASTGWKAPVLSYSNSSGAFAGADVGGSKIGADEDAIHKVYGESTTFQAVLNGQVQPPAPAQQFLSELQKVAGT